MYSTINIAPQWELNLKAYAQVSPTKQDNVQIDGAYNSDYTSKFLGLSANAGRVCLTLVIILYLLNLLRE